MCFSSLFNSRSSRMMSMTARGVHFWLSVPYSCPIYNAFRLSRIRHHDASEAPRPPYMIRRGLRCKTATLRPFLFHPFAMAPRTLQLSAQSSRSNSPVESDKLLALPAFRSTNAHSASSRLRVPLLSSYALLLVASLAYLGVSGYASWWRTSAYIGAISGFNAVFFSAVLLITCWKIPHPLAIPPSASLGARVCATLLSGCWAVSTAFVVAFATSNRNSPSRSWVLAELSLSILACLCTLFVMGLQFAQYSRRNADVGRMKVCPPSYLTFGMKSSYLSS